MSTKDSKENKVFIWFINIALYFLQIWIKIGLYFVGDERALADALPDEELDLHLFNLHLIKHHLLKLYLLKFQLFKAHLI